MDELTLLKDMADRTPLPSAADLDPARARLMATIHTARPTPQGSQPVAAPGTRQAEALSRGRPTAVTGTGAPRRRRGLILSGVAVVGLAAAITGVVALGGLESVGVAPAKASAAEILHQAADAARALPSTPPRPDQFVYTKTQLGDGSVREAWLSADGTRDGLIKQQGGSTPLPGCVDGQAAVVKGVEPIPGVFEPCTPSPAYTPDLPTDVAGMRQYLTDLPGGNDKVNSLGKNIHWVVAENYVNPAALAALFDAVAGMDGLTVVQDARDGADRPGVGVRWTHGGHAITMVFDEETHVFLGMSEWEAVVRQAVVDTAGQQP
jgi:hypothetical protein